MTAPILAARPTIKILLYTDDPNAITIGNNLLGLSSMVERLNAHAPVFADVSTKWVSRSSDDNHHADNKLNVVMRREVEETGEPFDEIWFFGLHQANTKRFSLGAFRGGPQSELGGDEVEVLERWMKVDGGGVLMTGDHNNPVPPNWLRNRNGRCADSVENPELLGLGRAIGRCVPRAGELRKWDGPPSSGDADCVNTLTNSGLQTDRVPQSLTYEFVNADGEPDPHGQPHPLFFYRPGTFIDIFPDHRHEGALVIPDVADRAVWPVGPAGQPKPCIVAFGIDRRTDKKTGLVSAYDGDRAGVGRIVADSSWHHYANINLKGFPHPAPPDSCSDKIGQFYGNLAIWLAPLRKRRQMAQVMYRELADYTFLLEQHDDPNRIGEIAHSLLRRSTSPCEIHELLRALGEPLGTLLHSYHQSMIRAAQENVPVEFSSVVGQGQTTVRAATATAVGSGRINVMSEPARVIEQQSAPISTVPKEWTIDLKGDPKPNQPAFAATLVFDLNIQDGVVTGQVREGVENRVLSSVTGTHQPLAGTDNGFLAIDFIWGNVDVALFGVTVETPETIHFSGRFKCTGLPGAASNGTAQNMDGTSPMAPGEGDTGTGTGQQT